MLELYLLMKDLPDQVQSEVLAVYLRRKDAEQRAEQLEWHNHWDRLEKCGADVAVICLSPDERDYREFNVRGVPFHLMGEDGDAV